MGCKDIQRCLFSDRVRPSAFLHSAWEQHGIAAQAGTQYVAVPRVWIPYAAVQPGGIPCAESVQAGTQALIQALPVAQAGIPDEPE